MFFIYFLVFFFFLSFFMGAAVIAFANMLIELNDC
jgi:hypothetical protein